VQTATAQQLYDCFVLRKIVTFLGRIKHRKTLVVSRSLDVNVNTSSTTGATRNKYERESVRDAGERTLEASSVTVLNEHVFLLKMHYARGIVSEKIRVRRDGYMLSIDEIFSVSIYLPDRTLLLLAPRRSLARLRLVYSTLSLQFALPLRDRPCLFYFIATERCETTSADRSAHLDKSISLFLESGETQNWIFLFASHYANSFIRSSRASRTTGSKTWRILTIERISTYRSRNRIA